MREFPVLVFQDESFIELLFLCLVGFFLFLSSLLAEGEKKVK